MAFPGGLQLGGGVTADNAALYLGAGASHVIVTSWVFREGRLDRARLAELVRLHGASSSISPPMQHAAHAALAWLWQVPGDACSNQTAM